MQMGKEKQRGYFQKKGGMCLNNSLVSAGILNEASAILNKNIHQVHKMALSRM